MTTPHKTPPLALTLRGYIPHAPELWRGDLAAAAAAVEECERMRAERDAARERTLALTPEEIEALVEFSGAGTDDGCQITIGWLDQHEGGAGWYAWLSEYPEEGSVAVKLPYDDHNADDADDAALADGDRQ